MKRTLVWFAIGGAAAILFGIAAGLVTGGF